VTERRRSLISSTFSTMRPGLGRILNTFLKAAG
jgi:hypothetical protein